MLDTDINSIKEVLFSIQKIETYVSGIYHKDLLMSDSKTYDAVLLQFIVIGESCKRISTELKTANPHIDWRGANDFRNFVAHDYFGISEDVIWSVLQFHLPKMRLDFKKLLELNK
jgi:uncharacterized protein with HEPN domain